MTDPEIFRCPEFRFSDLEKRVDRFGRRAAKLGLPPITVEVVGEDSEPVLDRYSEPTGRVRVFILFVVHGEAPRVAGHTFIARIEHTEAGNIISKAPGCESVVVPAEMRDGPPTCDHCKTNRRRNDTFVLRKDEFGDLIRVGRNCLADYLRSDDAAEALRVWTLLHEITRACGALDPEEAAFGGGAFPTHESTVFFVACVVRTIELCGWVSRKAAYESDGTKVSTAEDALFACGEPPKDSRLLESWRDAQPTKDNSAEAVKAVEWAKSLSGDNDYEHNLKVACTLSYVKAKNHGLVASAASGYRRYVERELAAAREAERAAKSPSSHFGTVGSRYVRKLTVTRTSSWENEYGVTFLYVMEDDAGSKFKWFSSGGWYVEKESRTLKADDTFYVAFAVKKHGDWKGVEETTITRATLTAEPPTTHKWVGVNGEIFKTKKAMKAAVEAA